MGEKWGITMRNILIMVLLIFTLLFCNSTVLAAENIQTKTVTAIVLNDDTEDTKELIRTGIRITFWLFPILIGVAIIKNMNVGKDKK